jgi:intracellular sulfur oxidation DsrE/DsrF family protein
MSTIPDPPLAGPERRSFLNRLGAGAAAVAGLALGRTALAQSPATSPSKPQADAKFEAARHDQDNWMDIPARHRFLLDTHAPDGVGNALLWGANYIRTSQSDYGVQSSDLAFIIVVRHRSVSFGYNDAMWAKYGAIISKQLDFLDPKTKEAPKTNLFNYGQDGSPRGTWETMAKAGVQVAVCSSATRNLAGSLARATSQDVDAVVRELSSNLVRNGRMVPAGIITVAHAIEKSYAAVAAA